MESKAIINTGLRGITVASTKISDVQGQAGKLIYRGYLIQELAEKASFEEIIHLLLFEKLPSAEELENLKHDLKQYRALPDPVIKALQTCPKNALPMDILQAGVALMASYDPDLEDESRQATMNMGIRLVARLATLVAAWDRIRNGKPPIEPDPDLDHAANFLYMLSGSRPDEETARFFDVALVLHAEHSFNASTFSARQVASTKAHIYSAICAALGSLSGSLHGGANVRVMQMLLEIGSLDNVAPYVENILDKGRKIMGLGHAVYKTDDPRALILAPMAKRLEEKTGGKRWYPIARLLEEKGKAAFKQRKGTDIYVNVDFYSAVLYYAMQIPVDLFTPIFAVSRISGWTAHVLEERFADAAPKPMLYRPESEYVGHYCGPEECSFVPLPQR